MKHLWHGPLYWVLQKCSLYYQPRTCVQHHISNFTFHCFCKWLGIWFQTGATWSCHLGASLFIIDLTECRGIEIIEENAWCYSFAKSSAMQLFSFSLVQFQFHAYSFTNFFCSNGLLSSQHLKVGKCPLNQKSRLKIQNRQKKYLIIVSARWESDRTSLSMID